jgi:ankyrin repeat protein
VTKDGVDRLHERQNDRERREKHQAILDWLTPIDYAPQQNDSVSRRQEGTGQWLLNSSEFQKWLNTSKQTLFCPGIPGAGKTMITSIVINDLYIKFQNDASVGIAYIYFNFRRQQEQKPPDLLASLLKQLIQEQPFMPEHVKSLYERHKNKRTRPSFDEISKALDFIVADYSRAFIIIDALDEYQISDGGRERFLAKLFDLQARTGANLFATSRLIPETVKEFEGRSTRLEIRASNNDLQRYLDGHMLKLPSFVSRNADLQKDIKTAIINAVDGMYVPSCYLSVPNRLKLVRFLLAQLHLDSLIGKRSPKAIRIVLEKLPEGSEAYDHAYNEAMERIEGQVADSQELAKQVLAWIICARRPLTTLELRHAIALEIDESKIDEENLPEIEDMVSVCAGLVTVDEQSEIIRLVHYTTQEYFERTQTSWFPDAQKNIAIACVIYLSFDAFETGFCSTDKDFEARLQLNPLYDYAARNWGYHTRAASIEAERSILDLLKSKAKVSASSQAMIASKRSAWHSGYSQEVPKRMRGVHLAAYFGLEKVMTALLKNGYDLYPKDSHGRTPLSWAADYGHETVVKLLLEKGAELESKDNHGRTPLLRTAWNGHEAVMKLLLEKGAELESIDNYSQTPLSLAAGNGHETVVKLLLEKGAELESKDKYSQTPLSLAAGNGHEAVAKLLLATASVDPDSKNINGRTPLSWAAANGHETVVKLLLATDGVDPNSRHIKYGQTPLHWAVANGHETVVKLLLATDGVDPNSKHIKYGQTPLHWAAANGHEIVVKLLLATDGIDPNSKDTKYGQTPLYWAAVNGHDSVVKLLLAADGIDPDSKDTKYGRTPLSWAAEKGHEAVVKLLLAKDGIDPNSTDTQFGRTPLSWAAANGHGEVVELLLAKDSVEPNSTDTRYCRIPLSMAAARGHEAVVATLAKRLVDPDSKDKYGQSPLLLAAGKGYGAVVKLLLTQKVVDPASEDKFGRTPLSWAAWRGNPNIVKLLLEKYKDNGIVARDEDVKIAASPAADHSRITCDICLLRIPNVDSHTHCGLCVDGDFDICRDCVASGAFCFDQSHKLIKRTVKNGMLVDVPD